MATRKHTLNTQEQAFVDAYGAPPWPSAEAAAAQAGYKSLDYGRALKRKPHIAEAINARVEEHKASRARDIERVMARMLGRAVGDESSETPEKSAELYLEAAGVIGRGVKVVTSITNTQQSYGEKLDEVLADRGLSLDD